MIKVCLKASKMDQARQGCTLVVGRTGDRLCGHKAAEAGIWDVLGNPAAGAVEEQSIQRLYPARVGEADRCPEADGQARSG